MSERGGVLLPLQRHPLFARRQPSQRSLEKVQPERGVLHDVSVFSAYVRLHQVRSATSRIFPLG